MFCPTCAGEFRDGFDHCPDCDVGLVEERVAPSRVAPLRPASEPAFDPDETVELFWTADARFLVDAASRLSSASIPFTTDGAESLNPSSWKHSADEPTAARLLVPAEHAQEARVILDAHQLDPCAHRVSESEPRAARKRSTHDTPPRPRRRPETFLGRVARKAVRAVDYVVTLILKAIAVLFGLLFGLLSLFA